MEMSDSLEILKIVDTEGVYDFGVSYDAVSPDLSLTIFECLMKGGDNYFLTIDAYNSHYVLSKKVSNDISTFYYPLTDCKHRMCKVRVNSLQDAYNKALSSSCFRRVLNRVYKDNADFYYKMFLHLLDNGCPINDYLSGSFISTGVTYPKAIDSFILNWNYLIRRAGCKTYNDKKLYWCSSFVIGFNVVNSKVNVIFTKSVNAFNTEYAYVEKGKIEDIKKLYVKSLSLDTLLNFVNNDTSYGDNVNFNGLTFSLTVDNFMTVEGCKLLKDYLKAGYSFLVSGNKISFTKDTSCERELSTSDFNKLFNGSKDDTHTLLYYVSVGGNTPEYVKMLKSGKVKLFADNILDILVACQSISLYKSVTLLVKSINGYFSIGLKWLNKAVFVNQ